MDLHIKGGNKKQRELIESMMRFTANKLMTRRLSNTLYIEVFLSRTLMKKRNIYGICSWDDNPYRAKDFLIELDSSVKLRRLLETAAHEMVHVKQYARGELQQLMSKKCHKFRGEYFPDGEVEYWDLPWEIEAHGRETGLFVRWAEQTGYAEQEWTHDDI